MIRKNINTAQDIGSPELDDAIAALIINTRRVKRKLNLIEIADKIRIAEKHLSIRDVADRLSLSVEMIREFSQVNLLAQPVKNLIKKDKISSIDIAVRLSRLPVRDQLYVARETIRGKLKSEDLRAVVSLRRAMPDASIDEIIMRIMRSKNIKEYIAEFRVPQHLIGNISTVRRRFIRYFGIQHVRAFTVERQGLGLVHLDKEGKNELIKKAKENCISKGRLLQMIVSGRIAKNA